jgi:hypothetical protein
MAPVLALVVETLVEHLHDLDKVIPGKKEGEAGTEAGSEQGDGLIVSQLRNLVHLRS